MCVCIQNTYYKYIIMITVKGDHEFERSRENGVMGGVGRRGGRGNDVNTRFICEIHKKLLNVAVIENTSVCH